MLLVMQKPQFIRPKDSKTNPTLWQALLSNRFRQHSLDHLTTFQPMEMIVRYGGQAPQSITGCYCGQAQGSNSMVGFLISTSQTPQTYTEMKMPSVGRSPIVPKSFALNLNAIPNLFLMETPSAEHRQRAQFIADHPDFQTHVSTLLSERLKAMGEQDVVSVEGKIYQGFYSANDKHLLAQFQNASWGERHQMLSQFHDQRCKNSAFA